MSSNDPSAPAGWFDQAREVWESVLPTQNRTQLVLKQTVELRKGLNIKLTFTSLKPLDPSWFTKHDNGVFFIPPFTVPKVHQSVSQSGTQWEKYWFQAPDPFDCEPCHSVNFLETERQLLFFFSAAQLENSLQWQTFIDRLFFISVSGKTWWRLPPRCTPHQLQPDKECYLFRRSHGPFFFKLFWPKGKVWRSFYIVVKL